MNVYYNQRNGWLSYLIIYGIIFLLLLGIGYYFYNYVSISIEKEQSEQESEITSNESTPPPPVPMCPLGTIEIDGICYESCPLGFNPEGTKQCFNDKCPENEDFTTSGNACIPRKFKTEYEDAIKYCPDNFNMIRHSMNQHKCQGGCPDGFPYQYEETCYQPCTTFNGKPHNGAHTQCYFLDSQKKRVKDQKGNDILIHNPHNVLSTSTGYCPPDFPHRYGSYCYRGCDQFLAQPNGGDHQCKLRSGSSTTIFDNPNHNPRLLQDIQYKCRDPTQYELDDTKCYLKCHHSQLARMNSDESDYQRIPSSNDCKAECPKGSYGLSNDRCSKKQTIPRPTREKIYSQA